MCRQNCPWILVVLLLMSPCGSLTAGINAWTTSGPYGGTVTGLIVDPDSPRTLYCGTMENGIFKSTDGGGRWRQVSPPEINEDFVQDLTILPTQSSIVFALLYERGIFRSTDSGETWFEAGNGAWSPVAFLLPHPSDPQIIYAPHYYGLYQSTDGGEYWDELTNNQGYQAPQFQGLVISSNNPLLLYGFTDEERVYRSTDGGVNWERRADLPGHPATSLALHPSQDDTLLATVGRNVYLSTDGGSLWLDQAIGAFPADYANLLFDPADPGQLLARTWGAGVFISPDLGQTWTGINSGLPNLFILELAISPGPSGNLYAGTEGGGVFCHSARSGEWQATSQGIRALKLVALETDPHTPGTIYAGSYWSGGVFVSRDYGLSWEGSSGPLATKSVNALAVDPKTAGIVYAATEGGGFYKSTDSGRSWELSYYQFPNPYLVSLALDPQNPTVVYTGAKRVGSTLGALYQSTDGGISWSELYSGMSFYSISIAPSNPDWIYAGVPGQVIWLSMDGGANWVIAAPESGAAPAMQVTIDPADERHALAAIYDQGLFVTTDAGFEWKLLDQAQSFRNAVVTDWNESGWIGVAGDGFRLSRDGGENWRWLDSGLTTRALFCAARDRGAPCRILAGSAYDGIFVIEISSDLNLDGLTDDRDAATLGVFLAESIPALPAGPAAADISLDGSQNVLDLLELRHEISARAFDHR